jgi:environmental stress-induced protein Ves
MWSAASVSGIDAEGMPAGLVCAGFEATGSASDLFGVVRIVNILSDAGTILQRAGHGALNAKAKATKQFHASVSF